MNKQVFIRPIPLNILYDLLEKICEKNKENNEYIVDLIAYKKMLFFNYHPVFIKQMRPYYFNAKMHYCDRPLTYNSFTNMVRQICKFSGIALRTEIKYDHSIHNNIYYVSYKGVTDLTTEDSGL